jgi:hypothetical protein
MGEEAFQFGDKKAMRNKDIIGIAKGKRPRGQSSLIIMLLMYEETLQKCTMIW